MDAAGELVRSILATTGLKPSGVAKRAGVSGSTLHRIVNDQVDPSLGTLREIGIACGVELTLGASHLSDPMAAAAARSMLEEGYEPPDDPEVARWRERLPRLVGSDNPVEVVKAASEASSPLRRRGTALYSGQVTLARLASAGDASRGRWAVSGPPGLYLPPESDAAAPTTILWCEDARTVDHLLVGSGLRPIQRADRATVAVIAGELELFAGSFVHGIVRYVAPIQIALDCISQGGQVAADAVKEVMSW